MLQKSNLEAMTESMFTAQRNRMSILSD